MTYDIESAPGFWFTSTLFEVEPGEDWNTNPGMYGKQLSAWISDNLESAGYEQCDSFAEDWGWCVTCSSGPYRIMIGCGVYADASAFDDSKSLPDTEDLLWYVEGTVSIPWLERLRGTRDPSAELTKLTNHLEGMLVSDPEIDLVDEPEDGDWSTLPPGHEFLAHGELEPPKPMPGWQSVALGLLLVLALPLMFVAIHEAFYRPPAGREIVIVSMSLIILIPTFAMCVWAIRLLIPPLRRFDAQIKLTIKCGIILLVFAAPLMSVYAGFSTEHPRQFLVQIAVHVGLTAMLWRWAFRNRGKPN
ncbi:MAG: hypothetical protein QNI99_07185 [Woeseiaceae bacterium]|nr:hypothetical protein [Woeseiaceae bacterium]